MLKMGGRAVKFTHNEKRLSAEAVKAIFLISIAAIGIILYFWPKEEEPPDFNGYPLYISDLLIGKDTFWILRARNTNEVPRAYDLYRLDENGRQIFVQPYPGGYYVWDRENEKLYDQSDGKLHEFDPKTGAIQTYSLQQSYEKLCTAVGETVFLQQKRNGPITMYSISDAKASVLGTRGRLLLADSGYLLLWDSKTHQLACHDYRNDTEVWEIDLSEKFSSAPVLCISGEDLYLGNSNMGRLYMVHQFAEKCELIETDVYNRVIGMVSAGEYVIYANKESNAIGLGAIYPDGTSADLPPWEGANYAYSDSRLLMAVYQGAFYCALQTEDKLFSYDLSSSV